MPRARSSELGRTLFTVSAAVLALACSSSGGGAAGNGGSPGNGGSNLAQGGSSNASGGRSNASGGAASASGGTTSSSGGASSGGNQTNGGSANAGQGNANGGSGNAGSSAMNGGSSNGGSQGPSGGSANGGASAGTGALGGNGGATASGTCGSLPLCDTFESATVGAAPDSKLWTLIPPSGSGMATVDSMGAHGSSRSLKIVSPDRLYLRNSSVIGTLGDTVHVRFFVRFASALAQGHGALIVTHPTMVDQYSQQNELRFGSQDNVFHWNTDSDAANVPDVSPNGDAASFKPVANTWYCVELTINTSGNLSAAVDGTDVAGLAVDGTPTANIDQSWLGSSASLARYKMLADFNFGWQSYGAGAMTLWFDDIALSKTKIGCQ